MRFSSVLQLDDRLRLFQDAHSVGCRTDSSRLMRFSIIRELWLLLVSLLSPVVLSCADSRLNLAGDVAPEVPVSLQSLTRLTQLY